MKTTSQSAPANIGTFTPKILRLFVPTLNIILNQEQQIKNSCIDILRYLHIYY
jgi:hypothetical protein